MGSFSIVIEQGRGRRGEINPLGDEVTMTNDQKKKEDIGGRGRGGKSFPGWHTGQISPPSSLLSSIPLSLLL